MMGAVAPPPAIRQRVLPVSLIVGLIGAVVLVVGWVVDPLQFFRSYLWAYAFWLGLPVGSLGILMIQYLTGGVWGLAARRVAEAGAATLAPMAVLFLPLFAGLTQLYPWTQPSVVAADEALGQKAAYLNVPFFVGRTVLYFLVWVALAYFLLRWSAEQDRTGDERLLLRLRHLSAGGVVALGVTVSFAAIDWLMSLEPTWYSTVYGARVGAGMLLTAFALTIVVLVVLASREPLANVASAQLFNDFGSLLLAFLMLWAYMTYFELTLIWAGNLGEEISWYLRRLYGPWEPVAYFVGIGAFAVPFVLLLFRPLKRNRRTLGAVASFLFLTRVVDVFGLVAPAFYQSGPLVHWLDPVALVGLGGLWLAAFAHQLAARPLLALNDPRLAVRLEVSHGPA
jgi:hypothetical protein